MNSIRKKIGFAISLAALTIATPALADQITLGSGDVGQSFTLNYNGFVDGNTISGLTGTTTFTLTSATSTSYSFDYSVTNTSSGGVDSRISSFAFNTDPTITGASSTGTYDFTVLNSNYPNGIGTVDVCFKAAFSNSCAGNSGGVLTGETGTGTLTLSFTGPVSEVTLSDFFVRYQSITGAGKKVTSASGEGTLTSSGSTSTGGTPVPEPGMLGLFGAGAIGLAMLRRRRKQLKAA